MGELSNWMMVFVRCSAMLIVFPVLSSTQFPTRLRVALAAFFAFLVAPGLPMVAMEDLGFFDLLLAFVKEVMVGLLLGFVSRLTFHALEFFAGIVGIEVGINIAASFNPLSEGRSEVFGTFAFLLGAMLMFTLDLHHWVLAALQKSFVAVPIGGMRLSKPLLYELLARTSGVFQAGLVMAAPVLAISFLISVTFAVISRAVPAMNVFSESFPFRVFSGLMVFGFTLGLTAQHAANYLRRLPEDLIRLAQALAPH